MEHVFKLHTFGSLKPGDKFEMGGVIYKKIVQSWHLMGYNAQRLDVDLRFACPDDTPVTPVSGEGVVLLISMDNQNGSHQ